MSAAANVISGASSAAVRRGVLVAICVLVLLPSWVGLLGAWHWTFDLLAHFRWQYLAASAALLLVGAWRRAGVVIALASVTLVLNLALIGRLAWAAPAVERIADDFSLRVMSFNVLYSNQQKAAVRDYLAASDVDMIVLLEVDEAWLAALAPLRDLYPYQVARPGSGPFGIALLSRLPLDDAKVPEARGSATTSVEATLTHQGHSLLVIGAHPVPPVGEVAAQSRDRQLRLLADRAARSPVPVLLVGDLNASPWSVGMRMVTSGNLDFRSRSAPWVPTWRVWSPFAVPIDHALATAPLVITTRSVGPDLGSDHRPLVVGVGIEASAVTLSRGVPDACRMAGGGRARRHARGKCHMPVQNTRQSAES